MVRKTVLIVDDDKNIRRLVESALIQNGFDVLQADSGESALDTLKASPVNAVILDIVLPGIDGLETLRTIKSDSAVRHIPVIMLTCKDSELDNVLGLELGADDYIGKPIRYHELIARVKSVLRRSEHAFQTSSRKIRLDGLEIDLSARSVIHHGIPITLSFKEFELLALLAKNPGKVFTRDEILDAVWKEEYSLETRTVDVHIRRVRKKLELDKKHSILIETIRNVGYRLIG